MSLINAALAAHAAGIVALPVKTDGSKAPALPWKQYQTAMPSLEQLAAWFAPGSTDGIGILTGPGSGGLEMLELEGRAVAAGAWGRLCDLADDNGAAGLLQRICDGYSEDTPSGGIHLLYRVPTPRRNTKLARTADGQVLAETRGDGGFVVIAPSSGRSHPTGLPWTMRFGEIGSIASIDDDERDLLWALASMLDEQPQQEQQVMPGGLLSSAPGLRPGDDFAARASWEDILIPHGWRIARTMGRGLAWRRPGKSDGISATTNQSDDGVDRLYVFTTSTDFESERPYGKFAAYALLEHGGDYSAAAKALVASGYGSQPIQAINASVAPDIQPTAPQASTAVATEDPAATLARSEDGHSQLLIHEYGSELRYCPEMGRWLHWDGFRWRTQSAGGGIAREFAKSIARGYPDDNGWASHKKRSLSASGTSACLALTETDYRITVHIDALDARPWELNTPGGIVDLRTGRLMPAEPKSLHTRSAMFAPDFDADQSPWTTFLETTFQGDAELIGFIQRLMGYACVGTVREAILPVFYGQGANGKTVLLDTVRAVLGDYATVAPQRFLVQGPAQHSTEVAALAGARLVIASETNEGERFDEAKVKLLTGGDRLKARFMRQDEFTFSPTHLLVMMTNHRPEVGSGGTSFWRRVREIPFAHIVPEEMRDPELKERLVEQHGPAIMAWLATGAAHYARDGLREPQRVQVATQAYEASTDTVARFVEDMVILGGGEAVKVNSARVREAYEAWCAAEGERPVSAKALTTKLCEKWPIAKVKGSRGVRYLAGLTLAGATADAPHAGPDDSWVA